MAEFNVESFSAAKKSDKINIESYPLTVHIICKSVDSLINASLDNALFNGQRLLCPAMPDLSILWLWVVPIVAINAHSNYAAHALYTWPAVGQKNNSTTPDRGSISNTTAATSQGSSNRAAGRGDSNTAAAAGPGSSSIPATASWKSGNTTTAAGWRITASTITTSTGSPSGSRGTWSRKWIETSQPPGLGFTFRLGGFARIRLEIYQCCGSGSGFVGSVCFWASWIRIRILLSSSKNCVKSLIPTVLWLLSDFWS
jgi:hypothetical protein